MNFQPTRSSFSNQTFKSHSRSRHNYKISDKEGISIAKRMFDHYDRDRSGFLDEDQIAKMIKDAYRGILSDFQPSVEDVKSFIGIHDKNNDGMVTLEDWEKTVSRYLCHADDVMSSGLTTNSPSRIASKHNY